MDNNFVYPDPQEMSWPYHIHYLYNSNPTAPTQNDHQHLAREELRPVIFVAPDDSQSWVGLPSQYWPLSTASQGTNISAANFDGNPARQSPSTQGSVLLSSSFLSSLAKRQVSSADSFKLPEAAPILRGSTTRMDTDLKPKSKVTKSKGKPRQVPETDPTKRLKACAGCRKAKSGCVKGRNEGDPCRRCTTRGTPCELAYRKVYGPRDEGEDPAIEDSDVQGKI
ncbi:hypothetical protein E4T46_01635 [Aureobasidium subglaciale]|nr:hypothetical protein E4T40_01638 [Aureobasidium subglaciale]KAI5266261.1 hypothetical protein E4T46_01635 [Aureobasidium subglaciale]